ncbi:MAG TPA: hypothetical protein ENN42_04830 [Thioalkalivibrio sp.]|nr:hypothetical protein [Thioalkalivibrio sp.]
MLRFGRLAVIVGIIITSLGMVVGFSALFTGADTFAKPFLGIIPVGFLMTFAGLTTTLLIGTPRK